jgi:hypothetical protein
MKPSAKDIYIHIYVYIYIYILCQSFFNIRFQSPPPQRPEGGNINGENKIEVRKNEGPEIFFLYCLRKTLAHNRDHMYLKNQLKY